MNCWSILGIKPTHNLNEIKKAYAEKVKLCHPEEDPEGFEELHKAYRLAIKLAPTIRHTDSEFIGNDKKTNPKPVYDTDFLEHPKENANVFNEISQGNTHSNPTDNKNLVDFNFNNLDTIETEPITFNPFLTQIFALYDSRKRNNNQIWKSLFNSYEFLHAEKNINFRKKFADFFVPHRYQFRKTVWDIVFIPLFKRWKQECHSDEIELMQLLEIAVSNVNTVSPAPQYIPPRERPFYENRTQINPSYEKKKNFCYSRIIYGFFIICVFIAKIIPSKPANSNKLPIYSYSIPTYNHSLENNWFSQLDQESNAIFPSESSSEIKKERESDTTFSANFSEIIEGECVTAQLADDLLHSYIEKALIENQFSLSQLEANHYSGSSIKIVEKYLDNFSNYTSDIQNFPKSDSEIFQSIMRIDEYNSFVETYKNDGLDELHMQLSEYTPFQKEIIKEKLSPYIAERIESGASYDRICALLLPNADYDALADTIKNTSSDQKNELILILREYEYINIDMLKDTSPP